MTDPTSASDPIIDAKGFARVVTQSRTAAYRLDLLRAIAEANPVR